MAIFLVNSLKGEDVHGTDNTKKTACGIKYSTPDAAKLYALGKEMSDIKELTCDRCKEILAVKMIKEANKQAALEAKEERKRSKAAAKSIDYIPAPETKTNYTAPRPVQKNIPAKTERPEKSTPKEDFKVNGEFVPKSLRKYGSGSTLEEAQKAAEEAKVAKAAEEAKKAAEEAAKAEQQNAETDPTPASAAIPGMAPINIPGIDIVAPQPTGFVSEVANAAPAPAPKPVIEPINIPGIDIVAPAPTGFVSEVADAAPAPAPKSVIEPINIPGIETVEPKKSAVDMIDFSDFEDFRVKSDKKPLDLDDLDDFLIGAPKNEPASVMPEIPSIPEVPTVPEAPAVPQYTAPAAPAMPEIPSIPEVPTVSEVPTVPQYTAPAAPVMPEIPSIPEVPTVSEVPTVPQYTVPAASVMPEIPSVPQTVVSKAPVVAPLDSSRVPVSPSVSEEKTMAEVNKPSIVDMTAPVKVEVRPNIQMTTNIDDDIVMNVPTFAPKRVTPSPIVEEESAPVPVITSLEDMERALNKMQGIEVEDTADDDEDEPEVIVPAFKEYKPMTKSEIEKRKMERAQKQEPDRPLTKAEQKRLEKEEKKKAKIDAEFAKDMAKRGITLDSMRDKRRR